MYDHLLKLLGNSLGCERASLIKEENGGKVTEYVIFETTVSAFGMAGHTTQRLFWGDFKELKESAARCDRIASEIKIPKGIRVAFLFDPVGSVTAIVYDSISRTVCIKELVRVWKDDLEQTLLALKEELTECAKIL